PSSSTTGAGWSTPTRQGACFRARSEGSSSTEAKALLQGGCWRILRFPCCECRPRASAALLSRPTRRRIRGSSARCLRDAVEADAPAARRASEAPRREDEQGDRRRPRNRGGNGRTPRDSAAAQGRRRESLRADRPFLARAVLKARGVTR